MFQMHTYVFITTESTKTTTELSRKNKEESGMCVHIAMYVRSSYVRMYVRTYVAINTYISMYVCMYVLTAIYVRTAQ